MKIYHHHFIIKIPFYFCTNQKASGNIQFAMTTHPQKGPNRGRTTLWAIRLACPLPHQKVNHVLKNLAQSLLGVSPPCTNRTNSLLWF